MYISLIFFCLKQDLNSPILLFSHWSVPELPLFQLGIISKGFCLCSWKAELSNGYEPTVHAPQMHLPKKRMKGRRLCVWEREGEVEIILNDFINNVAYSSSSKNVSFPPFWIKIKISLNIDFFPLFTWNHIYKCTYLYIQNTILFSRTENMSLFLLIGNLRC